MDWEKGKELEVKLDTKITPKLEEEAKTRELVRKIQEERKNMGVILTQKIVVVNDWFPKDKKLTQWLQSKTLAIKLEKGGFKVKKA